MGYKVKVYETTGALPSWLCHGKLVSERKATYYRTPGKAKEAAESYASRHPGVSWTMVDAVTGYGHASSSQLRVAFDIDVLPNGGFRVRSVEASIDVTAFDLPLVLGYEARNWAEQVVDDLGGSRPVDIFKLDMDEGE